VHGQEAFKIVKCTSFIHPLACINESGYATYFDACAQRKRTEDESVQLLDAAPVNLHARQIFRFILKSFNRFRQRGLEYCNEFVIRVNASIPVNDKSKC